MDPRQQSPDVARHADHMRAMVRVQNAIGFVLPSELWHRGLKVADRQRTLREKTIGLVLHDMTINGEITRLKSRLMFFMSEK
jgi:hypothetical protein